MPKILMIAAMCDIHRQFILCNCVPSKGARKDPHALTWWLSRHEGLNPFSMEGIMGFPAAEIADGLSSEWVENQLNAKHCFDFDYKPAELDELRIAQGSDNSFDPKFLSFLFKNGQWQGEEMHRFEDLSTLIHEGKLEFAEKSRLNTVRAHLIAQLHQAEETEDAKCFLLAQLLRDFEAFEADALEDEWQEMLPLIVESALEATRKWAEQDAFSHLRLMAELRAVLEAPKVLPTVPLRRSIGANEAGQLWEQFQARLGKATRRFVFDEAEIDAWKARMASREVLLYNLCPFSLDRSCALSSLWVQEMLQGDDSYWVACDFSWALYAEGNGYFEVLGVLG